MGTQQTLHICATATHWCLLNVCRDRVAGQSRSQTALLHQICRTTELRHQARQRGGPVYCCSAQGHVHASAAAACSSLADPEPWRMTALPAGTIASAALVARADGTAPLECLTTAHLAYKQHVWRAAAGRRAVRCALHQNWSTRSMERPAHLWRHAGPHSSKGQLKVALTDERDRLGCSCRGGPWAHQSLCCWGRLGCERLLPAPHVEKLVWRAGIRQLSWCAVHAGLMQHRSVPHRPMACNQRARPIWPLASINHAATKALDRCGCRSEEALVRVHSAVGPP